MRMQVKTKTNLQHKQTHTHHTHTLQKDYANVRMQVNTNLQKTAFSQSMRTHVACPVPWFPPGALFSMRHAHTLILTHHCLLQVFPTLIIRIIHYSLCNLITTFR